MSLTDNEIVRAFVCCHIEKQNCIDCPAIANDTDCVNIEKLFVDVFNRLQADKEALIAGQETLQKALAEKNAKIEGLKSLREEWKNEAYNLADAQDRLTSENNELRAEIERLKKFKTYFDSLYGTGLEVAFFHQNGELESFDSFYDSATKEMAGASDA